MVKIWQVKIKLLLYVFAVNATSPKKKNDLVILSKKGLIQWAYVFFLMKAKVVEIVLWISYRSWCTQVEASWCPFSRQIVTRGLVFYSWILYLFVIVLYFRWSIFKIRQMPISAFHRDIKAKFNLFLQFCDFPLTHIT